MNLKRARELCEAATPGPWVPDQDYRESGAAMVLQAADTNLAVCFMTSDKFDPGEDADAEFIAAARTLLPAALDAIEAAIAEVEQAPHADNCAWMKFWRPVAEQSCNCWRGRVLRILRSED